MQSKVPESSPEPLDDALERICFLEWRIEQLEANLTEAHDKNRALRSELSAATREHARLGHEQASLTDALAEARREAEVLDERLALAERDRVAAQAHEHRVQARMRQTTQSLAHEAERERTRAEADASALADARERLDRLERAQAQFFARLDEWQRLLGTDPDRIDLAELIAELRGEVLRLSAERAQGLEREASLRLALVQARPEAPAAPSEAEPNAQAPAEAEPTALPDPIEALEDTPESRSTLRAALKARLTHLDDEDTRLALEALPEPTRARALALAREAATSTEDRALAATRGLARIAPEAASAAIAARLGKDASADRARWLEALASTAGPLARQTAARHAEDPDWAVRGAALEALLSVDPEFARPHLQRALEDEEPRVRRRAAMAARARLGRSADDLLSALLSDPCPETRRLAAALVGGSVAQRHARARPRRTTPWST